MCAFRSSHRGDAGTADASRLMAGSETKTPTGAVLLETRSVRKVRPSAFLTNRRTAFLCRASRGLAQQGRQCPSMHGRVCTLTHSGLYTAPSKGADRVQTQPGTESSTVGLPETTLSALTLLVLFLWSSHH